MRDFCEKITDFPLGKFHCLWEVGAVAQQDFRAVGSTVKAFFINSAIRALFLFMAAKCGGLSWDPMIVLYSGFLDWWLVRTNVL